MFSVERTQGDINNVLDRCDISEVEEGTLYPTMTYENGVKAAIEWITGQTDEYPL